MSFRINELNGRLELSDGRLELSGGRLELSGGRLELSGGRLELSGGRLELSGGRLELSGGRLELSGGRLELSGGRLELSGGRPELSNGRLHLSDGSFKLSGGSSENSVFKLKNYLKSTITATRKGNKPFILYIIKLIISKCDEKLRNITIQSKRNFIFWEIFFVETQHAEPPTVFRLLLKGRFLKILMLVVVGTEMKMI